MPILPTLRILRRNLTAGIAAIAALGLTSCGLASAGDGDRTISIIVTESAPFQEPTEIAKDLLAEDGWELETTYVTDIIQPNHVVSSGEYDANYFQHLSYLDQFNTDNKTEVEPAFSVFYMPNGFFSVTHDSVEDLPDGAQISLAVDTTNNGRGIKILADAGLIEIDETVPVNQLSQESITANPRDFDFIEVDLQSTGQTLPDVDAAFAPSRLIAEAGYDMSETTLLLEDSATFEEPFTVAVGVQPGEQESEKTQALQEAYQSEEVAAWFDEYLDGAVQFTDDVTVENVEQVWADFTAE
ncbi:MetQ/NlpA family ABC transporter substrate-binding protein [Yaniella halotolerans]|uniref:MetQ/NlpA family ABC transporter substrate-binding protein n=1 Tax=Yaniella halotolerans TaxID=225453 RepID=UPI0003B651C3|nr:MetQ/NlpA family ABC transporter substrate-binding protein [Yaniella halotolerans]